MSQLTSHTERTRAGIPLLAWVALVIASTAVAVLLALAITSGDDAGIDVATPAATASGAPGVRYDGGPEEGTRGPSSSELTGHRAPAIRYDGGPEEGTRGLSEPAPVGQRAPGVRYDGGPEEGTRGIR